ncbi:WUSCHEL-related homeobox 9-like isoform X1 [Salvia splendens]|uniref:WUSCHEL-related homeobox 9-like isoform X1 n=1 Tax=Salvia splendens TaxID=180675 RepID=UPI001C28143F|nr:WUSCHEL-related homeobox 9-like isoform X1 [Salvia splendens]
MASSNRHWPSMFKSKPPHLQWQRDINSSLISSNKTPYAQVGHGCCEERTPEPKPRWNPRPEQIRILEGIFNSGMVNPPRDEIRRIRAQLQEYGQVGDANVFYWFQNRKSRSKHKQRHLQTSKPQPPAAAAPSPPPSSSSSDKSSSEKSISVCPSSVIDLLNSPTASVNQPFLHSPADFLAEPFYFPGQHTQELCFPVADPSPNFLLSELMLMTKKREDEEKMQQLSYTNNTVVPPSFCVPSPSTHHLLQGVEQCGPTKSTVFINDVCLEIGAGPFNVREAFGDDATLFHSSGQPVLTDEWGLTLHPLHHGAFYYLLRPFLKI